MVPSGSDNSTLTSSVTRTPAVSSVGVTVSELGSSTGLVFSTLILRVSVSIFCKLSLTVNMTEYSPGCNDSCSVLELLVCTTIPLDLSVTSHCLNTISKSASVDSSSSIISSPPKNDWPSAGLTIIALGGDGMTIKSMISMRCIPSKSVKTIEISCSPA